MLMVRYIDPNNYIGARIDGTDVALIKVEDGVESSVSSAGYDAAATMSVANGSGPPLVRRTRMSASGPRPAHKE